MNRPICIIPSLFLLSWLIQPILRGAMAITGEQWQLQGSNGNHRGVYAPTFLFLLPCCIGPSCCSCSCSCSSCSGFQVQFSLCWN